MLTRNWSSDEEHVDPDQPMVGRCMRCGAWSYCLRSACEYRADPTLGRVLCVGCTTVTGQLRNLVTQEMVDVRCDNRVFMSKAKE